MNNDDNEDNCNTLGEYNAESYSIVVKCLCILNRLYMKDINT